MKKYYLESENNICQYCLGCNRLEQEFKGVLRCNNFVPGYKDWQERLREELKRNGQNRNTV